MREEAVAVSQNRLFIAEGDNQHEQNRNDADCRIDPEEDVDCQIGWLGHIHNRRFLVLGLPAQCCRCGTCHVAKPPVLVMDASGFKIERLPC
ncbi:hypothetical protein D3C71_1202700 [compost metagenome]